MDKWLKDHLEALGIIRADGVSRRVTANSCAGCGRTVLRALDGDRCAVAVTVDIGEVDQLGELTALLQGRRTFDMLLWKTARAYSYCLEPRRACHIAKPRRYSVYVEHRCQEATIPAVRPTRVRGVQIDDPPF